MTTKPTTPAPAPTCAVCAAKSHKSADCPYRFGGQNYDHASTPDGV